MIEELVYHSAALDKLEVNATATAAADLSFFIFEEWGPMSVSQKKETVLNKQDLTGVMYMNRDFEFQSIFIISSPTNRLEQDTWLVGKIRNRLSRSPEGI